MALGIRKSIPSATQSARSVPKATSAGGELVTIGYEGHTITTFLSCLAQSKVDLLIDIRELPLSRKRAFAKTKLMNELEAQGITYRHIRALGAPRPIRHKYRAGGSYSEFRQAYEKHLEHERPALDELAALASSKRTAIMCVEKDASRCHRGIVGDHLAPRGIQIVHA